MRTFEEIQERMIASRNSIMQRAMQDLEKGGLKDWEERAAYITIQECQSNIENIGEVTTIEIGAETNSLIKAIQTAYRFHLTDYWQNFERFIDNYVSGLTPDGERRNGAYFGQSQCLELGVGINELLCFKGRDPMNSETGDLFRQIVNANCGTNIPMSGVEQQALQEYESVAFGDDEIAKAQALIHLKEVQRDSGTLRNGGTYYTLATDQNYQDAKAICTGLNR